MARALFVLAVVLTVPCGIVADSIDIDTVTPNPVGMAGQFRYDGNNLTATSPYVIETVKRFAQPNSGPAYQTGRDNPYGVFPDWYQVIPMSPMSNPLPIGWYNCWAELRTFDMPNSMFNYTTSNTVSAFLPS